MTASPSYRDTYDAIIVGARCAGASTALLLARAGARVLVIDRQALGSDRISTHALMRGGVLQLLRWGLLPKILAAQTPRITQTVFHYGDEDIRIDIKPEHGVEFLCAPRRTVLDRILVEAAVEAGADVRHNVSLGTLIKRPDGRVTGVTLQDPAFGSVTVRAGIVIGADGRQSMVARQVGASTYAVGRHFAGVAYRYFDGIHDQGSRWFFKPGASAGVVPTNDGQHCVFVCIPKSEIASKIMHNIADGYHAALTENSETLSREIEGARPSGRITGFAGAPGHMRTSQGRGWALVGDAGYFKDPLTAHGMTDALRDAEILARAVLQGNERALALYQEERDALSHKLFAITDRIASFQWDMADIRSLHMGLQAVMKSEVDHMASVAPRMPIAA
ncbi:MAG: NAD(P)/FAD-dependent oxidoreductase [Alphaproteobacteria bacterium]|nr:NAD(P)/FAD-dependent oxidoreductase [Alphaproteobacteria bacterium]